MNFMEETRENAENKVLLLFFADKVRMPVSSMQLTRIMLEHRFMNYFHMQQCLHELADNRFLSLEKREGTDFYAITPEGMKILDLFGSLISEGVRTRLQLGISEIRIGLMRETSVTADSLLVTEDEYQVTLRIAESDIPLFETRMSVGSRDDARLICRNWRENANSLYPQLIALLLAQPSPPRKPPAQESLQQTFFTDESFQLSMQTDESFQPTMQTDESFQPTFPTEPSPPQGT